MVGRTVERPDKVNAQKNTGEKATVRKSAVKLNVLFIRLSESWPINPLRGTDIRVS